MSALAKVPILLNAGQDFVMVVPLYNDDPQSETFDATDFTEGTIWVKEYATDAAYLVENDVDSGHVTINTSTSKASFRLTEANIRTIEAATTQAVYEFEIRNPTTNRAYRLVEGPARISAGLKNA